MLPARTIGVGASHGMEMFVRNTPLFVLALAAIVATAAAQTPEPRLPEPSPVPVVSTSPPEVPGTAWVLMDHASGRVLAERNARQPLHPASITKVMTSYIVADTLARGQISESDEVHVSERAWRQGGAGTDGSFSALEVNSRVPLPDVVRGLVVQSGNDASIALAEHIAGSEEAFADLMNQYARKLGMNDSHFVNSHGLTAEGHLMSAYDIAVLARALIRDFPEHYQLYSIKEYTYGGITQHNRNGLLWRDASVDGIKTGHTSAAGYCLAVSAKRGDQRLISAVLGIEGSRSEGFRQREEANQTLLNWGFRAFETHRLYGAGQTVAEPELWRGANDSAPLAVAEDVFVTIPRGRYEALQAEMVLPELLIAPLESGQRIGSVKVSLDGELISETPLVSVAGQDSAGFFRRTWHDILLLFH